jgi:hypothetical protein
MKNIPDSIFLEDEINKTCEFNSSMKQRNSNDTIQTYTADVELICRVTAEVNWVQAERRLG